MSAANVQTIQTIYGAFGRGDLETILQHVTDDVEFAFNAARPEAPWHATFKGTRELPGFFGALGAGTKVLGFVPEAFTDGGAHVAVAVRFDYVLEKNGRPVSERQVHWWTFDAHGKVARLLHHTDTAAFADAWRS